LLRFVFGNELRQIGRPDQFSFVLLYAVSQTVQLDGTNKAFSRNIHVQGNPDKRIRSKTDQLPEAKGKKPRGNPA